MEIRNVQTTGGTSITLTLPKEWVKKFHIKGKDRVVIDILESGQLLIQPYLMKKIKTHAKFSMDRMDKEAIIRELSGFYIAGADEIHILSKKIASHERTIVREAIRKLIGLEILEETSEKIIVKNIFDGKKFPVRDNVEKMFGILLAMYTDVIEALKSRDKSLAYDIIERDEEIDKFNFAIMRQCHALMQNKITEEETGLPIVALHYYENTSSQLERIADHVVKIARMIIFQSRESQKIFTQTLQRKAKKLLISLESTEKMVRQLEKNIAHEILDTQQSIKDHTPINKNIINKSSVDIIIEDSLDRIRGYISNIAEGTINYIASQ